MAGSPDFIHCMLIPLHDHFLLLPNPTIAEVIPMPAAITPSEQNSNYCLGSYDWRDKQLPVIDLESMLTDKISNVEDANKLCILNGINPQVEIEFYALPCYGAPQLITLNETALQPSDENTDSSFLHCQIKIGNKVAFIPHLDNIEKNIKEFT